MLAPTETPTSPSPSSSTIAITRMMKTLSARNSSCVGSVMASTSTWPTKGPTATLSLIAVWLPERLAASFRSASSGSGRTQPQSRQSGATAPPAVTSHACIGRLLFSMPICPWSP